MRVWVDFIFLHSRKKGERKIENWSEVGIGKVTSNRELPAFLPERLNPPLLVSYSINIWLAGSLQTLFIWLEKNGALFSSSFFKSSGGENEWERWLE